MNDCKRNTRRSRGMSSRSVLKMPGYRSGNKRGIVHIGCRQSGTMAPYRRNGNKPGVSHLLDLETVVNAFMEPLFERSAHGGRGWKAYFALVAQVNNSPELAVLMTRHFDPVVHKFIELLQHALPAADPRDLLRVRPWQTLRGLARAQSRDDACAPGRMRATAV